MSIPILSGRGARRPAGAYAARERRKSHYDPAYKLYRTHAIAAGDPIDTATSFPGARTDEITFATTIKRSSVTSSGLVFEIGSEDLGVAVAVDGNELHIAAGEGLAANANGGATLLAGNAVLGVNTEYRLVVSVRPGDGMLAAWVNGRLIGAVQAADLSMVAWSDTDDGSAAAAAEGTVLDRIPSALQIAPSGFALVAPLSVYRGQRPRQMPDGTVLPPLPTPGIFSFDSTTITFDSTIETFDEA